MIIILFCFFYGCSISINNGKNLSKNNKTEFFTTKGEVIISHIQENEWIFDYKLDKKIKYLEKKRENEREKRQIDSMLQIKQN